MPPPLALTAPTFLLSAALSIFGRVTGYFFKFEVTSRGVLHAHGQISQPLLKPDTLKAMLSSDGEETRVWRHHLLLLPGPSLSCALC